jgi:23S rRNA (cytidine1920-2'-O)/16S rRNA (cytidine1409-2'-O)-methyltransferase
MRLDQFLVHRFNIKSRSQASDLIARGLVLVNQKVAKKAGLEVSETDFIEITYESPFVSRSGEKLRQALVDFKIELQDKICLDIGSSTGGFTDCALQHGASLVYAYDVGKDQMDPTLRHHPKIHLFEETNILDVSIPNVDVIMIDVSFTSIKPILEHLKGFSLEMICLIKPQYEAGHIHFKQGVLKDQKKHKEILFDVLSYARSLGFSLAGLRKSELLGKTGNQEYILYIKPIKNIQDIKSMVGDVL